ncbi:MAG TPA: acyltransferase [Acidobacteriota bacterium]|jgi:acetyltransferase-like isoleucine patch superfamily enzyme|nr:acyltransferase [Acidobacteriota bacterium]HNT17079.1 acyltransferase [Acidobacteriota bacterium]HPA26091.1 acyltransferase [Acidobacteriota bacterium]HQO19276.1 acyltransferase [Acidobacteriota bacterium]HQQ46088.1 acyltransferase [Acidobacteriota bacterium]
MSRRSPELDNPLERLYNGFTEAAAAALDNRSRDRNETVRDLARDLLYPCLGTPSTIAAEVVASQLDPRNVTLEAEYYGEMDERKFYEVKPLLWLWRLFDMSPAGHNARLGLDFRRMLAARVFRRCGSDVKIFENVTFSFGYNIDCGDRVTIHRNVLIDDRGEVEIGDDASLSDYANVYTHSHDPLDPSRVTISRTVIGRGARITYHSTVLAGVAVEEDAILGSHAVATREVRAHHIAVGLPAKSIRIKKRD